MNGQLEFFFKKVNLLTISQHWRKQLENIPTINKTIYFETSFKKSDMLSFLGLYPVISTHLVLRKFNSINVSYKLFGMAEFFSSSHDITSRINTIKPPHYNSYQFWRVPVNQSFSIDYVGGIIKLCLRCDHDVNNILNKQF